MKETESDKKEYLIGYQAGFMASLKLSWAMAEELLRIMKIKGVDPIAEVQKFIDRIKT